MRKSSLVEFMMWV